MERGAHTGEGFQKVFFNKSYSPRHSYCPQTINTTPLTLHLLNGNVDLVIFSQYKHNKQIKNCKKDHKERKAIRLNKIQMKANIRLHSGTQGFWSPYPDPHLIRPDFCFNRFLPESRFSLFCSHTWGAVFKAQEVTMLSAKQPLCEVIVQKLYHYIIEDKSLHIFVKYYLQHH